MSPDSPSERRGPLRTFAFGAPGHDAWVAGWFPAGTTGMLLAWDAETLKARGARLEAQDDRGPWGVTATGAELQITPASPAAVVSGAAGTVAGYEQAAQVSGTVDDLTMVVPGRRGERPEGDDIARLDSVREVAAWFDGAEVVAMTALRPRKHKGHDQDTIHAAVVEPVGNLEIVSPRLSTTYTVSGRARRVGVELWGEDEEQPPVRMAAEALGRGGSASHGGWEVTVEWLLGHCRGRDGTGIFLLARPV